MFYLLLTFRQVMPNQYDILGVKSKRFRNRHINQIPLKNMVEPHDFVACPKVVVDFEIINRLDALWYIGTPDQSECNNEHVKLAHLVNALKRKSPFAFFLHSFEVFYWRFMLIVPLQVHPESALHPVRPDNRCRPR